MVDRVASAKLYDESTLFAAGVRAGELAFLSQDARGPDGSTGASADIAAETRRTLDNLRTALHEINQDLDQIVYLTIVLTRYDDIAAVAPILDSYFPDAQRAYPAICFLGTTGLDGGCAVRMDAIATTSADRGQIVAPGVPLGLGNRCHGVRVGDLFFLSGVDAEGQASAASTIEEMGRQTLTTLDRIAAILQSQGLALGDVVRTFMFMSDLRVRPGYQDTRRERYIGIFKPEEFPANSGIGVQALGPNILLRSVAIATRDQGKAYVSSDQVRLTPNMFSQSVRTGPWLWLAGQDAIDLQHQTLAIGDVAEQTTISLQHIKDVVEAAGGTLDDVVKTTVYLVDGQDRDAFAAAYRRFFQTHSRDGGMPAGLSFGVKELATDCLVEIDAVAYLGA